MDRRYAAPSCCGFQEPLERGRLAEGLHRAEEPQVRQGAATLAELLGVAPGAAQGEDGDFFESGLGEAGEHDAHGVAEGIPLAQAAIRGGDEVVAQRGTQNPGPVELPLRGHLDCLRVLQQAGHMVWMSRTGGQDR